MENFSSLFRSKADSETSCLISVKSDDLLRLLSAQYSIARDPAQPSEYDVIQPQNGAYIHLYPRLNIVLFELNRSGDYTGPKPDTLERLLSICSLCLSTPVFEKPGPALVRDPLEQVLADASFVELLIQQDAAGGTDSQCRATFYKGQFRYSEQDVSRTPSFIKSFRVEEVYIQELFSKPTR